MLIIFLSESRSVMSDSLQPRGLYSPQNSPGQNTGVGRLSLLRGIFPTQGSNPSHQHCRWILYQLSHKGSPRILEWVAYPFSSGSSRPRNWTRVSYIAGGFFTNWAMREALTRHKTALKSHTSPEHFLRVIWEAVFWVIVLSLASIKPYSIPIIDVYWLLSSTVP